MLVHKETNSLLLKLRDPTRVTNHLPKTRMVMIDGMPVTQVRFGLDESRVLRNIGIPAPSPIRYFYQFCIKPPFKPFDHQVTTAEFLTLNPRAFVLNDMGTGKTLSVCWAFDYLKEIRRVNKMIIVCPKSTMKSVWEQEFADHFLSKRRVVVLSGDRARRKKLLADMTADVYIINHDGLQVIEAELAQRTDIDLWVIDESRAFCNADSKRHKRLAKLIRPTDLQWQLTATPVPNSPTDAWGLAKLMHGNRVVPALFNTFKNDTMFQISEYKWVPKPGAYEKAYAILQPGLRFKKEDCLDLPDVTFQTHMCSLSPDQQAAYKAMISTLVANIRGTDITAANAAVKATKLLQVCLGSLYDEHSQAHDIDSSDRLKLCEDLVEQARRKVIVFVPFTAALDKVVAHLSKRWSVAKVDGSVADGKRAQIFNDFQNAPHPHILVAHPKVAAHGLTLTAADLTVWYGPITSLEYFEQANNRMNRPGQKFKMTVAMIAATMLEQNLYQALKGKQDMQNSTLAMFKAELGLNT